MSIANLQAASLKRDKLSNLCIQSIGNSLDFFQFAHQNSREDANSEGEKYNGMLLNQLPEELLQNVLQYCISRHLFRDSVVHLFLHRFLREIDFSRASTLITDLTLEIISKQCSNLHSVNLDRCFNISEKALLKFLDPQNHSVSHLKSLNLTNVQSVSDRVVEQLSGLEVLILSRCDRISNTSISIAVKNCPELLELSVFSCIKLSDEFLFVVAENCPNLSILSVSRIPNITDRGMERVLESCKVLQNINVGRCRNIGRTTLSNLSMKGDSLRFLDLTQVGNVTCDSLVALMNNSPNLEVIYLSATSNVYDPVLEAIASSCPNLKKLYLSRQSLITDQGIGKIAQNCKDISVLNLSRCSKLTGEGIREISHHCRDLDTMYLSQCYLVTSESLSTLFFNCVYLTIIELNNCTQTVDDDSIEALSLSCPRLRLLDLTACTKITSEGIRNIANSFTSLVHLGLSDTLIKDEDLIILSNGIWKHTLDTINLSGCVMIFGRGLNSLLQGLKQLGRLYLARCELVGINTVQTVTPLGSPNLEAIFLTSCVSFEGSLLIQILDGCSNLNTLVLSGSIQLNDDSLKRIPEFCPNLQLLDISGLNQVTDVTISSIATGCTNINTFTATGCAQITDESVSLLIKNLPYLSSLVLSGCSLLSSALENTFLDSRIQLLSISGTSIPKENIKKIEAHILNKANGK
eukprot:TRINITY_DN5335_c0_g1_i1.p1 TRINITY_DN5335_c0_g1~~TRINITY_DN5335_c0_g1_i1.p1  ORF type:complete len:692 (-),score=183.24 TRINITY_DN5335_c0_g1_i1:27-2102(-)